MNRSKIIFAFIIMTLLVPWFNVNSTANNNKSSDVDVKSIIVKFRNKVSAEEVALKKNQTVTQAVKYYSSLTNVEYAEPNFIVRASMIPSDTHYNDQWYLQRINAADAWNINTNSKTIIVAIVDSGVQINHPDIMPNLWTNNSEIKGNKKDDDKNGLIDDVYGWDFVNNVADPSPKFKAGFTEAGVIHGTVIAGITAAAGNNNQGITGITWKTKIMSLKALDDQGNGNMAAVIKSVDYATTRGANIINLSFVGFNYSRALEEAILRATNAGVIIVAPAGNEQATTNGLNLNQKPVYPACYRDANGKKLVIGVAATDGLDQKAVFSGYGKNCVDIAAPGVSFFSTTVYAPDKSIDGRYFSEYYDGYWSGTSMAVPVISGVLALIEGTNPGLSPDEATKILLSSADNINQLNLVYSNQLGSGRVNAAQAVLKSALTVKNRRARFAFTPAKGVEPVINITDNSGNQENNFLAYSQTFLGGVNLASGDVDKDGNEEIITAPSSGMEANVKIFNNVGVMLNNFLAYPYSFKGGVNVTAADIDGDGKAEIITAPKAGSEPIVKIFKANGKLIRSFLAYPPSFKGGVSVAVGNVRDDKNLEIITAPGIGGIPQIKVFDAKGILLNSFLAGARNENYGFNIALGDLDANPKRRQSEIILSRQSGEPIIMTYDFRGNKRQQWNSYFSPFSGNVDVIAADLNRDGFIDIITIPVSGGGPHLRIFNYQGEFERSFYAYSPEFNNGVKATVFLTNN